MAKGSGTKVPKRRKRDIATFSQERFEEAIELHPRAKRAHAVVKGLEAVGEAILAYLKMYVICSYLPAQVSFAAVQMLTGFSRKKLDTMARNYKTSASEIARLNSFGNPVRPDPEENFFPPTALYYMAEAAPVKHLTTRTGQSISIEDLFALLPQVLAHYSEALPVAWPSPEVRSGQAEKQVGKNLYLYFAALMAEKMLDSPCYTELALLIVALHQGFGANITVHPENLRKAVSAFKRRNPHIVAMFEMVSKEQWARTCAELTADAAAHGFPFPAATIPDNR